VLSLLRLPLAILATYATIWWLIRDRREKPASHGEHVHEWMLASDSQIYVLCQAPGCDEERVYVGDPLTTSDIERLSGTKAVYNDAR
jgi:hypothetical protein